MITFAYRSQWRLGIKSRVSIQLKYQFSNRFTNSVFTKYRMASNIYTAETPAEVKNANVRIFSNVTTIYVEADNT
jgi:hypothetical protein